MADVQILVHAQAPGVCMFMSSSVTLALQLSTRFCAGCDGQFQLDGPPHTAAVVEAGGAALHLPPLPHSRPAAAAPGPQAQASLPRLCCTVQA